MHETIKRWHEFVETRNSEILDEILADEVKFHSPVVWKPKEGKPVTKAILISASEIFQDFRYVRQIAENNNFMLEFEAKVGDFALRGVDIIALGADGKIVDFEVMVRPANALQTLGMEMSRRLSEKGLI